MTQLKENKYVTIPQLAKILGLSRIAVFRKVKSGEIQAEKIGRIYAINRKFVQGLLGQDLDERGKREIDIAVGKTVKEYGATLKLLGRD
jgi:excisionase family DNA binding protein